MGRQINKIINEKTVSSKTTGAFLFHEWNRLTLLKKVGMISYHEKVLSLKTRVSEEVPFKFQMPFDPSSWRREFEYYRESGQLPFAAFSICFEFKLECHTLVMTYPMEARKESWYEINQH